MGFYFALYPLFSDWERMFVCVLEKSLIDIFFLILTGCTCFLVDNLRRPPSEGDYVLLCIIRVFIFHDLYFNPTHRYYFNKTSVSTEDLTVVALFLYLN